MINILKFNGSNNYNYSWGISSKVPYNIFKYLDDLMLIYYYKLPSQFADGHYLNKYQCKNQNKIIFDKLKGNNLCIFHIDTWKDNPDSIRDILNYCNSKNIDVWMCIHLSYKEYFNNKRTCIVEDINTILKEYDTNEYDLTNYSNGSSTTDSYIKEICKPIIRDIQLNKLL